MTSEKRNDVAGSDKPPSVTVTSSRVQTMVFQHFKTFVQEFGSVQDCKDSILFDPKDVIKSLKSDDIELVLLKASSAKLIQHMQKIHAASTTAAAEHSHLVILSDLETALAPLLGISRLHCVAFTKKRCVSGAPARAFVDDVIECIRNPKKKKKKSDKAEKKPQEAPESKSIESVNQSKANKIPGGSANQSKANKTPGGSAKQSKAKNSDK